jgi:CheY-like chemotaxis protein
VTLLSGKSSFDANVPEDRRQLVNTVLHAMDLSNVAYPWAECVPWARRVGAEFAEQVTKEKAQSLPVSVFMDVNGDLQLAKLQVGFVSFVIKPFFEKVAFHIKEFHQVVDTLSANVERWKTVQNEEMEFLNEQDGEMQPTKRPALPSP